MTTDYESLSGKRVNLTTEGEVLEGRVEAGSPIGVVFKKKGSSRADLVLAEDIEAIEEIKAASNKLRQSSLARVAEGRMRRHLVDRHGYRIVDIEPLAEFQAVEMHDQIDHSELGHKHRALSAAEAAVAKAEKEAAEAAQASEVHEGVDIEAETDGVSYPAFEDAEEDSE